jgi:type II secretory pathway component GspD/PulD (secretin)
MKRFLMALLLVPVLCFAKPAPVRLSFDGVSLVAFSQVAFVSILRRDFVIAPDVLAADRKITIHVKGIELDDLPAFLENLLLREGIATTLKDGVYYLSMSSRQNVPEAVRTVAPQTSPIASPLSASLPSGSLAPSGDASGRRFEAPDVFHSVNSVRADDDESIVYDPQNRDSDFMVAIAKAAFGPRAATRAGPHLVLTGSKQLLEKMITFLETADTPPKGLDVSASWIEVSRSGTNGGGISLLANVLGTKLGFALGTVNSGSAISVKNSNFELVIDAIRTDGRFKQVSNSRVAGDDYETLNVTFGDETPTVASAGKDNAGNAVQNVVYRPSGVIVDVVAKVLGSGRVKLQIDGQISSFKPTSTGVTGSPTLIKRQVKTTITVANGEVLLIGGLNDSQAVNSLSSLPFLPATWGVRSSNTLENDLVLILSANTR